MSSNSQLTRLAPAIFVQQLNPYGVGAEQESFRSQTDLSVKRSFSDSGLSVRRTVCSANAEQLWQKDKFSFWARISTRWMRMPKRSCCTARKRPNCGVARLTNICIALRWARSICAMAASCIPSRRICMVPIGDVPEDGEIIYSLGKCANGRTGSWRCGFLNPKKVRPRSTTSMVCRRITVRAISNM